MTEIWMRRARQSHPLTTTYVAVVVSLCLLVEILHTFWGVGT